MFPILLSIFILIIDFFSKEWTQRNLPLLEFASHDYPYGGIGVFKSFLGIEFSIVHAINHGAAWGAFSSYQEILVYLRIILIVGLLIYAFFLNTHKSWQIPFALIIAGASGNVLDYFLYGHVVDMFKFVFWGYHYPVFNIADSAIFVGVVWFILTHLYEKKEAPPKLS